MISNIFLTNPKLTKRETNENMTNMQVTIGLTSVKDINSCL